MSRRKMWMGVALMMGMPLMPAGAQSADQLSSDQKIQQLEQKVDQLDQQIKVDERRKEIADEDAATKAANSATASADTSGFTIKSNDGNFLLKIGADLQVDNRAYLGQGASAGTDGMLLRRIRPTISGTVYKYVDYFFRPDFGQGSTIIYDAYLELKYLPFAKVRVGKFKPPVGLERLQSDDDTSFVERGLPTLLVPSRDIGYQISGDLLPSKVNYALGVFNGVPDNSLTDAAVSGHRDYDARLFLTPFKGTSVKALDGLGFGSGIDGGGVDGEALPAYKTFGQTTFFTFASGVTEAGHRTRVTPQGYYYAGPFGILSEYTLTEEGLKKGLVQRDVAFRAWQVEFSYILTGEKKSFASPTPKKSFDPLHGGWGAVELAARTGEFSAEHGVFNYGFASTLTSPRTSREWVGGVNWFLNRLVRVSLDYGKTGFGGGAAASLGGNRAPERVLIGRFQINFI